MNKVKCVWRDFTNNFFSKRLLTFCVFQFCILHYYIHSVKQFSILADYPAAPWILPFIGENIYFQLIYAISVIHFYSNIPFMQKYEMYALVRQGRKRWVLTKMLRIWMSAVMLSVMEMFLSILLLAPQLEWTSKWGKLYNSLAMTDAGSTYQVRLLFSYELINENDALKAVLMLLIIFCIVTGSMGMLMFTSSICINRTAAVLIGTFFSVLTVVFANLYSYQEWISFISPFSWLDLLLLNGRVCKNAPSFLMAVIMAVVLGLILCIISLIRTKTMDLNWTDEE